jgi:hypothetical protein
MLMGGVSRRSERIPRSRQPSSWDFLTRVCGLSINLGYDFIELGSVES